MKIVYYYVEHLCDHPADGDVVTDNIFTTSKSFWDKYHHMDDGGPDYDDVASAMQACGALEWMESSFSLYGKPVDRLIAEMRTYGFDMQASPEFIAACTGQTA